MVKVRLKIKLGSLENVIIANKARINTAEKNMVINNAQVKVVDDYEVEM